MISNSQMPKLANEENPGTVSEGFHPGAAGSDSSEAGANAMTMQAPTITLPKGGGAIRGIGEKFAANPVTGTGSMSVPIATSPGRSGFGPQLSLSYDSGAGNSAFGFGWTLSLPSITRKTDKGLPRYLDLQESDVFILSGAEDLVPVYRQDPAGTWVAAHPGYRRDPDGLWVRDPSGALVVHEYDLDGYRIRRYRPRIEGLFARIERWAKVGDASDVHWRSISKDNALTVYGLDTNSRIADPLDPTRIFSWLICETRDDKGNGVLYRYKAEDGRGVDLDQAHQRNRGPRDDVRRTVGRYLKRIYYGNRTPLLDDDTGDRPRFLNRAQIDAQIADGAWMFEVVFDYDDHDGVAPKPTDDEARDTDGLLKYSWKPRPDPFSSYRSGFEVRTARLCQRVLMFHHFPGEAEVGRDCLVRSTDFTYSDEVDPTDVRNPVYAFLRAVTQTGYRRNNGGYDSRSLPPLEFEYTKPIVQDTVEHVDPESLENLPVGLDGSQYRWTDLHGEGIPGILSEQASAWFYKRNWSPLPSKLPDGREVVKPSFSALETVALQPNVALSGGAEFMDLAGDGHPDVVVMDGPNPGLFEHDDGEGWQPFRPFTSRLTHDMRDPNLKLVDLDGDGHADVLVTEDDAFVWHASLAKDGFGPANRVTQALDEEEGPRIVFADGTQSIYLADLSGDGLIDIVRIRNGEVCYWPNLGYGRFGAKITMDNSPSFDAPDQFNHTRIRLADIDGSGTTDIIYLHRHGIRLYFNQSGNSWGQPHFASVFPRVDDVVSIVPMDLFGNGTACLVWSSPLAADSGRQMRYVNLMGAEKPHLLVKTVNNLGAETRVNYAPSTKFYLRDRRAGKPWITRLPFPVHVVERVETFDHIGRNRFVTRYAYHHGYFDGEEREFRGFGMVEQWDTELAALTPTGTLAQDANTDEASHVPPVHTRTWFHTGVYLGRDAVSRQFEHEYFREAGLTIDTARPLLLDDTDLPDRLTLAEEREACRALKGMMLRQEVYADDAGPAATVDKIERAATPYTVTEQSFGVRSVQPRGANRHAVVFSHAREAIVFHYERNPADPRIQHTLTLEVDTCGNILKEAAIGYGRRQTVRTVGAHGHVQVVANPSLAALTASDQARQTNPLVTYTEQLYSNPVYSTDAYRNPLLCETLTFELTGYSPSGLSGRFQPADLVEPDPQAPGRLGHKFTDEVAYEDAPSAHACRRPIERQRTLYRSDMLQSVLPLGQLESLALPGETYELAFTPGLLAQVFQRPHAGQPSEALLSNPASVLEGPGGDRGGFLASQTLKADARFPASDPDDHWWTPSGRSFFTGSWADSASTELGEARAHFFLPRRYRDPFGKDTLVDFDIGNDLLIVRTCDAAGNQVTADMNDYRALKPRRVNDPNGNQAEVAYDSLGMLVGTAVIGKPQPARVEGDSLGGFDVDLTQSELDTLFEAPDPHPAAQALLKDATTRIVYDLDRFRRTQRAKPDDPTQWQPVCAAALARETHASAPLPPQGLKLQLGFTYSDGFGREIQKKIRAEPGRVGDKGPFVSPRWVGNGWTIFNNKGMPVRKYEPFFSATHLFEFAAIFGVSPVLFYDPTDRVIATLNPNHTFAKVVFDPWQQTSYDVNDTCAPLNAQTGNPRTDPDVQGYVEGYFSTLPPAPAWETWYAQRIGGHLGGDEQAAAARAAAHADTPSTSHLDVLGRPFLTVARNRVVCPGHDLDGTEDTLCSRVELDIVGNTRAVRDAIEQAGDPLGRVVMRYAYDMRGSRIHQLSMEAGGRWMLNDVAGKSIRAWDSRGHNFSTTYDGLRRAVRGYVRGTTAESDPRTFNSDVLVDQIEYGERLVNAQALNLRTRVYRHLDSAGALTNARIDAHGDPVEAYDFKGNLLHSTRRLLHSYDAVPNWLQNSALEAERFESSTRYDALNRPTQTIAPHSSLPRAKLNVIQPVFNDANLLKRIDVWLGRATEPAALLDPAREAPSSVGATNIDYDAKGRRVRIDYKNGGTSTFYDYDPLTFRLTDFYTRRGAAFTTDCDDPNYPPPPPPPPTIEAPDPPLPSRACGVQNLHYTYDPAGNITHIRDDAQQTIYFRNKRVEPSNDYIYDALYRLIQADGREHLGQVNQVPNPPTSPDAFNSFHTRLDHPGDGKVMGSYTERYVYDAVGNFSALQHSGSDPANQGWSRSYSYNETSLIEKGTGGLPLKSSNRLTQTTLNPNGAHPVNETYEHDPHGNMVRMPHLGGGQPGPNMHWDYQDRFRRADLAGGGTAFYVYDASGQRMRKVWEKQPGLTEERIYLGGFEIFRTHPGAIGQNTAKLERETLHVMGDRQRIALVETRTLDRAREDKAPAQLIRYQFTSHLGSTSLELDDRSQIISYEEYSPYGSSTYQAVRSHIDTPKRYRYTGKERDEESGFSYHSARYYAPWLGRWSSCDPAGVLDSSNLYLAFAVNPVRFVDRTGQASTGNDPARVPYDGPTIRSAPPFYGSGEKFKPSLSPPHPEDKLMDLVVTAVSFVPGGQFIGPMLGVLYTEHQLEYHEISPEDSALAKLLLAASASPGLPSGKASATKGPAAEPKPSPSVGETAPSKAGGDAPTPAPTTSPPAAPAQPSAPAPSGAEAPPVAPAPAAAPAEPTPAAAPTSTAPPPAQPPPAGPPAAPPPTAPPPPAGTAGQGGVPAPFRVGNAGETMAKFSAENSAIAGPKTLLDRKATLKNATGKTARPDPNSTKGARVPDIPIKGEGNAVGTVEVKTPYGSCPVDPWAYLLTHPQAANQLGREGQIMSQGGITWGPAGGPQWPVQAGEGIGVATGYWMWFPPTLPH